jgi:hypothetical protein
VIKYLPTYAELQVGQVRHSRVLSTSKADLVCRHGHMANKLYCLLCWAGVVLSYGKRVCITILQLSCTVLAGSFGDGQSSPTHPVMHGQVPCSHLVVGLRE